MLRGRQHLEGARWTRARAEGSSGTTDVPQRRTRGAACSGRGGEKGWGTPGGARRAEGRPRPPATPPPRGTAEPRGGRWGSRCAGSPRRPAGEQPGARSAMGPGVRRGGSRQLPPSANFRNWPDKKGRGRAGFTAGWVFLFFSFLSFFFFTFFSGGFPSLLLRRRGAAAAPGGGSHSMGDAGRCGAELGGGGGGRHGDSSRPACGTRAHRCTPTHTGAHAGTQACTHTHTQVHAPSLHTWHCTHPGQRPMHRDPPHTHTQPRSPPRAQLPAPQVYSPAQQVTLKCN